eukprot:766488-Amphidinium_carterae.1
MHFESNTSCNPLQVYSDEGNSGLQLKLKQTRSACVGLGAGIFVGSPVDLSGSNLDICNGVTFTIISLQGANAVYCFDDAGDGAFLVRSALNLWIFGTCWDCSSSPKPSVVPHTDATEPIVSFMRLTAMLLGLMPTAVAPPGAAPLTASPHDSELSADQVDH